MTDEPELTPRLGKVARRALTLHGITRYDQLPARSAAELLALHGVGPKAIRILREELTDRGLTLPD